MNVLQRVDEGIDPYGCVDHFFRPTFTATYAQPSKI